MCGLLYDSSIWMLWLSLTVGWRWRLDEYHCGLLKPWAGQRPSWCTCLDQPCKWERWFQLCAGFRNGLNICEPNDLNMIGTQLFVSGVCEPGSYDLGEGSHRMYCILYFIPGGLWNITFPLWTSCVFFPPFKNNLLWRAVFCPSITQPVFTEATHESAILRSRPPIIIKIHCLHL